MEKNILSEPLLWEINQYFWTNLNGEFKNTEEY